MATYLIGLTGFRMKLRIDTHNQDKDFSATQLQHIITNHAMANRLQGLYYKKGVFGGI